MNVAVEYDIIVKKVQEAKVLFSIVRVGVERRQLDYSHLAVCSCCGEKAHCEVFEEYNALTIFSFQVVRWNRRYYAMMTCCGARSNLTKKAGARLDHGRSSGFNPDYLDFSGGGKQQCETCGFTILPEFVYCPKCGKKR